jgi:predicted ATP-dependent protease
MPYVMVPVPEEHVQEIMQFIIRIVNRASIEPWDEDAVAQLFLEADEPSRSLLSVVARATLANRDLTEHDAATNLQLSGRETMGIMRELNDQARDASRPPLISTRQVSETLPNGRSKEKRVLSTTEELARWLRAAERAEGMLDAGSA